MSEMNLMEQKGSNITAPDWNNSYIYIYKSKIPTQ